MLRWIWSISEYNRMTRDSRKQAPWKVTSPLWERRGWTWKTIAKAQPILTRRQELEGSYVCYLIWITKTAVTIGQNLPKAQEKSLSPIGVKTCFSHEEFSLATYFGQQWYDKIANPWFQGWNHWFLFQSTLFWYSDILDSNSNKQWNNSGLDSDSGIGILHHRILHHRYTQWSRMLITC